MLIEKVRNSENLKLWTKLIQFTVILDPVDSIQYWTQSNMIQYWTKLIQFTVILSDPLFYAVTQQLKNIFSFAQYSSGRSFTSET